MGFELLYPFGNQLSRFANLFWLSFFGLASKGPQAKRSETKKGHWRDNRSANPARAEIFW
ncbi:hypothetical protein AUJ65_04895 [Candidatus Micrarchaeota archaeon CG1_02_51_15]|nr:MAG: hypothetical protein AUJ65_04895 [Candidatus Micrarchaeota archaeon CG1_02_51_15]